MFNKKTIVLAACIVASGFLTGCATQTLDFSRAKQGNPTHEAAKLKHFEETSHSVYMLFDLVRVKKASVDKILAEVNPENRPVVNLRVTSKEGGWATLVNWLNGGIIDRGVLVSLNTVTVEGDIVQP